MDAAIRTNPAGVLSSRDVVCVECRDARHGRSNVKWQRCPPARTLQSTITKCIKQTAKLVPRDSSMSIQQSKAKTQPTHGYSCNSSSRAISNVKLRNAGSSLCNPVDTLQISVLTFDFDMLYMAAVWKGPANQDSLVQFREQLENVGRPADTK